MSEELDEKVKLTAKQQLFVDDYLIHFNATKAAKNAGYSEKTAYSQGQRLLKNVEISAHVEARLKESRMNSDEVMKMMKDIAGSNINDYMKVVERERTKYVDKPLALLIQKKKQEIAWHERYIERKGISGEHLEEYMTAFIFPLEDSIVRAEIDLEFNPDATFQESEKEIFETIELDLVKLANDKESGKIKSFEWKEFGPKVELYPVDGMLDKLARVNGMYTDNLDINAKVQPIHSKVSPEQAAKLLLEFSKGNFNIE